MTSEICLASIPHTGTHFVLDLFRPHDFVDATFKDGPHAAHNTIYQGHLLDEAQISDALALGQRMPLVAPLRHPYWVEETWRRRSRDMSELVPAFYTLIERIEPEGFVFCIDGKDRQRELRRLAGYVGMDLCSAFPVVHSLSGTAKLERKDLSPSPEIERLVDDIAPFLSRYY